MLRRKKGAEAYENSTMRESCAVASAVFEAIMKFCPLNVVALMRLWLMLRLQQIQWQLMDEYDIGTSNCIQRRPFSGLVGSKLALNCSDRVL